MERMAERLMTFNAFGLVKITANEVTVTITSVTMSGKAIHRVVLQEFDEPLEGFEESEFLSATFGANLRPNGNIRLVFNDLIASENLPSVGEIPQVTRAIAKAIKMVQRANA